MPTRADIDPTEIPRLLSHLQMIEVADGGRFRFRLVGTAIVETFGRDYTSKFVDELFSGERRRLIEQVYRDICEARQAMFLRNAYKTEKECDIVANRLYLPLSNHGRNVSIILAACTFELGKGALVRPWESARPDGAYHLEVVDPDLSSASL